ncbi:molybdate ABC transporter permease subunit [Natranaerofaba carboxydovora]|uniref:molybdate ABC transporter permease subunit n=1 Tax=Natranaerofaba carboxydovora TaxID=2742683 RepID=UPI001F1391DF|nr:molybdate ABC transporter permease subunit [Natranaerofaba carboxydovora]UMZ73153.1 Molybdenum transport system permease protein ModB [Natranaerofaba carboxydovora]
MDFFPLQLSLRVSIIAVFWAFVTGIPIAYFLAKKSFKGKSLVEAFITLPIVLPPTVLGYYLLILIGRTSFIGDIFFELGIPLVFTWRAAVIASYVVSVPFLIKSARAAFSSVDKNLEDAARLLGRSELEIFFFVTIPLAWRGIATGIVLAFARAIGDFGTTIMISGNIPGRTQTTPIAIYDAVLAGEITRANTLVAIISIVALTVLFLLSKLEGTMSRGEKNAKL